MLYSKMKIGFKKAFKVAVFSLPVFLGAAFFALALENPIKSMSFATLIQNITRIVAQVGYPLAVLAIIWSGFLFVTARGDEQQVTKAKKTFFWAIIGATFIIGAQVFADAVASFVADL